jgi:hypothetical protein
MSKQLARKASKPAYKRSKARVTKEWTIVSFSVDRPVLARFKRACDREGIKVSHAIEDFMIEFANLTKEREK